MSTVAGPRASHDDADQLSALMEASNVAAARASCGGSARAERFELNPHSRSPRASKALRGLSCTNGPLA
jgi:hypothetical protein